MRLLLTGFLLGLVASCASSYITNRLINRTLVVHPNMPALAYPHCKKHHWFTGNCLKNANVVDIYDLTKERVRRDLADFVCIHVSRYK